MNKLFERMGVYDLMGILFSGFTISVVSYVSFNWCLTDIIDFDVTHTLAETVLFLFISYLIGTIIQVFSSAFIKLNIHKQGKPSELYLEKDISYFKEPDREILLKVLPESYGEYFEYFKNIEKTEERAHAIFDYCKTFLRCRGLSGEIDRIQSLYGLSRNLFTYFCLACIIHPVIWGCSFHFSSGYFNINAFICELFFIFFAFIFHYRCKKFTEQFVDRTLKTFCLQYILK